MTRFGLWVCALLLPAAVLAQAPITIETIPLPSQDRDPILETRRNPTFQQQETSEPGEIAAGAVLRALDKVNGESPAIELAAGQSQQVFALEVGLSE